MPGMEWENGSRGDAPGQAASDHIEVSVVIPCLNEANSVAFCIDKALAAFHQIGITWRSGDRR